MKVHRLSGVTSGFLGAIQRIIINGKSLKILSHNNMCMFGGPQQQQSGPKQLACSSPGVTRYRGPPCLRETCSGRGVCVPVLSDFHCQCEDGYTGNSCEVKEKIHENEVDGRILHHNPRKNKQR